MAVELIDPQAARREVAEGAKLIDVREQFGLVITNWHVVRDSEGTVEVVFPNGFRSHARPLKVDSDWDLAALVIWRPPIEPVRVSTVPPQPGDLLTSLLRPLIEAIERDPRASLQHLRDLRGHVVALGKLSGQSAHGVFLSCSPPIELRQQERNCGVCRDVMRPG